MPQVYSQISTNIALESTYYGFVIVHLIHRTGSPICDMPCSSGTLRVTVGPLSKNSSVAEAAVPATSAPASTGTMKPLKSGL